MTNIYDSLRFSARAVSAKNGNKSARFPALDYEKTRKLLNLLKNELKNPNVSEKRKEQIQARIAKIERLLRIKHLSFYFIDYNSKRKADELDCATRIDLAAKTMLALAIGIFAGSSAAGPQGAVVGEFTCAAAVLTTEIDAYIREMDLVHERYTEPQTILLNELKLYRDVVRMTDKNAKPTLLDFIEFTKYLESLEK